MYNANMSNSFWKPGLGIVCLVLVACTAPQKPTVAADPAQNQVAQPSQPGQAAPTPFTELTNALQGERPELQRRIIELSQKSAGIDPEDYEKGMILAESPDPSSPAGKALSEIRRIFQNLKTGASTPETGKDRRLIDQFMARHQSELHDTQILRILSPYHVDESEAAFTVRLLGINGSATLSIFLKPTDASANGSWILEDLQGDLTHMTEDASTRYNGYVPQDVERSLIREGYAKPWL